MVECTLRAVTIATAIALCGSIPAPAADPEPETWRVTLDPHLSIETGSRLTHGLVALSSDAESWLSQPIDSRPRAGLAGRLLRTALLDAPVAWWFGVLEHEAFGHGGRARELGGNADIHMGSPWGGRDSYTSLSGNFTTEELLLIFAGGSESNTRTAHLLEREMVSGVAMRPLELLFLASNRFVASDYVLRTTPDPSSDPAGFYREWEGGGDVANYLGYLSLLETGDPGITPTGSSALVVKQYERMERQAIWSALDPGAWLALYSVGRYVVRGDDLVEVPLPRVGGRRFLPALGTDWTPTGSLYSMELVFGPPEEAAAGPASWAAVTLRRGDGPGGTTHHVGAAAKQVLELGAFGLGGEVELWDRPSHGPGGGLRISARRTRGALSGLVFDVGVKSAGHWPGRPLGTGPFLFLSYDVPAKRR